MMGLKSPLQDGGLSMMGNANSFPNQDCLLSSRLLRHSGERVLLPPGLLG